MNIINPLDLLALSSNIQATPPLDRSTILPPEDPIYTDYLSQHSLQIISFLIIIIQQ